MNGNQSSKICDCKYHSAADTGSLASLLRHLEEISLLKVSNDCCICMSDYWWICTLTAGVIACHSIAPGASKKFSSNGRSHLQRGDEGELSHEAHRCMLEPLTQVDFLVSSGFVPGGEELRLQELKECHSRHIYIITAIHGDREMSERERIMTAASSNCFVTDPWRPLSFHNLIEACQNFWEGQRGGNEKGKGGGGWGADRGDKQNKDLWEKERGSKGHVIGDTLSDKHSL